jgi:hypothetical protein
MAFGPAVTGFVVTRGGVVRTLAYLVAAALYKYVENWALGWIQSNYHQGAMKWLATYLPLITWVFAALGLVCVMMWARNSRPSSREIPAKEVQIDGVLWRRIGDKIEGPFCLKERDALEYEGRRPKDSDRVCPGPPLLGNELQCPACTTRYSLGATSLVFAISVGYSRARAARALGVALPKAPPRVPEDPRRALRLELNGLIANGNGIHSVLQLPSVIPSSPEAMSLLGPAMQAQITDARIRHEQEERVEQWEAEVTECLRRNTGLRDREAEFLRDVGHAMEGTRGIIHRMAVRLERLVVIKQSV